MKVLVTGSGGYIGRHVVKALLSRGIDVIAADIRNDGLESSDHLKVMNCSIFDKTDKPFAGRLHTFGVAQRICP